LATSWEECNFFNLPKKFGEINWQKIVVTTLAPGSHPLSEPGLEVVKNEVRELLRHAAEVRNVVAHHQVRDREVGGGPERLKRIIY
jgi:hypothetical protein